jgi:excisionase family DNA binding protein
VKNVKKELAVHLAAMQGHADSSGHLEPFLVDIPDACRMIGVSRSKLYALLSSGAIPSRKAGKNRLIEVAALRAWAASLPEA